MAESDIAAALFFRPERAAALGWPVSTVTASHHTRAMDGSSFATLIRNAFLDDVDTAC